MSSVSNDDDGVPARELTETGPFQPNMSALNAAQPVHNGPLPAVQGFQASATAAAHQIIGIHNANHGPSSSTSSLPPAQAPDINEFLANYPALESTGLPPLPASLTDYMYGNHSAVPGGPPATPHQPSATFNALSMLYDQTQISMLQYLEEANGVNPFPSTSPPLSAWSAAAMDPPTEELIDSLPGPSLNYSILAQMMSSQDVFPTLTTQPRQHSNFSPIAFVDGLERVDISTIAEEDMRCPHCWLPFAQDVAYLTAFRELPFFEGVDDNDPVRTPCGHIFGKRCLLMSLEKTSRSCPLCRAEFISDPGSPVLTVSFPTFDELNTPGQ